jgi:hypothetical protein
MLKYILITIAIIIISILFAFIAHKVYKKFRADNSIYRGNNLEYTHGDKVLSVDKDRSIIMLYNSYTIYIPEMRPIYIYAPDKYLYHHNGGNQYIYIFAYNNKNHNIMIDVNNNTANISFTSIEYPSISNKIAEVIQDISADSIYNAKSALNADIKRYAESEVSLKYSKWVNKNDGSNIIRLFHIYEIKIGDHHIYINKRGKMDIDTNTGYHRYSYEFTYDNMQHIMTVDLDIDANKYYITIKTADGVKDIGSYPYNIIADSIHKVSIVSEKK